MAGPQITRLSVNAWVSFGAPIGGKVKCTGSIELQEENGAKTTVMTDGTVGVSSGIPTGSINLRLLAELGSTQQRELRRAMTNKRIIDVMVHDGTMKHPFKGILATFGVTSQPNEPIEYAFTMVGATGDSQ